MNELIHLKISNLPKSMGDLMHSNQFLKVFAFISVVTNLIAIIAILGLSGKAPLVLPLSSTGGILQRGEMPKPDDEIKEAIKNYIDLRYHWDAKNVISHLKDAEVFVSPLSLKVYRSSVANVARFSTEKLVSQKIYPSDMKVDLASHKILITGDRLTSIQGLKAAGSLNLELTFESGTRTETNPWGVYITKELEGQ